MTNDPGRETQIVDVHGRNIVIKRLVDTQVMLLAREAKILQRDDISVDRKLDGIDRMFAILESVVVSQPDKDYMNQLMTNGELDLRELVSFVTTFEVPEGDETPKVQVRRGRAPAKR